MNLKNKMRIAASLLVWTTSLYVAHAVYPSALETDKRKVIEAVRLMFVGLTEEDPVKFQSVTSPGFYAFDAGKRFSRDELIVLVKEAHAAGKVYVWKVTEPEVHIDGNIAWITYINRGSIEEDSGKKNVSWLESAILRAEKGVWRIHFFHSTRVPSE